MVSLKLFVDDVVVVHLSVCAGNSLSSMHHLMMRFEARAQNNTHIGNGKNPCTKVESRWREEREKNVQRAHIFLLCCLMVARKKGRNGRKIYTHNITNDMFGLGEAPGATSFLMARIC